MSRNGNPMTEPGHRSYAEQLNETLAFAVNNIPWYRDRSDLYRGPIHDQRDLARLPIIDRATVMADQMAFASSDQWPASISYSSSTTGGIGQPRWRGSAELDACSALALATQRAWIGDDEHAGNASGGDGVTLVIHPYDQGHPHEHGHISRRVYVAMFVPWHFDLIHQILRDGWASPEGRLPVTAIDCFSPGLRILTEWFDQRGIDPNEFGVERLIGYGSIQPWAWRRRLRASWGASYQDLYGFSEVVLSDAAGCPLCRAYHYTLPIIPEVVNPITREPLEMGTGALLLTELYPYAQLQLLMRYWTDDLVELAPPCPLGGLGIFFRGRASSSVVVDRDPLPPLVIGSLQVGEICAEVADVAVAPITWASWAHDVGAPIFSLAADNNVVRVTVELRYSTDLFPERAGRARDELVSSLRVAVAELADAMDAGTVHLEVDIVGPGSLTDPVKV
jgi:phenylacetate-coenzyme A ligase PaaK-like adenylate-forming protein